MYALPSAYVSASKRPPNASPTARPNWQPRNLSVSSRLMFSSIFAAPGFAELRFDDFSLGAFNEGQDVVSFRVGQFKVRESLLEVADE